MFGIQVTVSPPPPLSKQDSSDKYSAHVDTLEKQLLEFIKMDRTLDLVKKAMKEVDNVEAAYLNGGDTEEQASTLPWLPCCYEKGG